MEWRAKRGGGRGEGWGHSKPVCHRGGGGKEGGEGGGTDRRGGPHVDQHSEVFRPYVTKTSTKTIRHKDVVWSWQRKRWCSRVSRKSTPFTCEPELACGVPKLRLALIPQGFRRRAGACIRGDGTKYSQSRMGKKYCSRAKGTSDPFFLLKENRTGPIDQKPGGVVRTPSFRFVRGFRSGDRSGDQAGYSGNVQISILNVSGGFARSRGVAR
jgi:hypothetical protein